MLLSFHSRALRSHCEDPSAGWLDPSERDALIIRLADLLAAENLASMPVGVVWTEIAPEHVIITVSDRCRLVCRTNHVAVHVTVNGETDWAATTRLYVVNVELDGRAV